MSLRIATNLFGSGVNSNNLTYDYPSKTVTLNTITTDPLYLNTSGDSLEGELSLADNKLYFDTEKTQYLENDANDDVILNIKKLKIQDGTNIILQYQNGNNYIDFNNIILRNISDPINNQDVTNKNYVDNNKQTDASQLSSGTLNDLRLSNNIVTKAYLDSVLTNDPYKMYLDHKSIIDNYSVKFFVTAFYWNNLSLIETPQMPVTAVQDLSNTGITSTTHSVNIALDNEYKYYFILDGSNSLVSSFNFTTSFTFFWIGNKDDSQNGRLFNSLTVNNLLFYWNQVKNVYYFTDSGDLTGSNDTYEKNFFIFRNDNDKKTLWELQNGFFVKIITDNYNGVNDFGNISIGYCHPYPTESATGRCYLSLNMDSALDDADVIKVANKLLKYYF